MSLTTAFTTSFGVQAPIVLAPMGGSAGGALAAAVSNGGGLGLLGGGRGDRGWLDRELTLLVGSTSKPWGIGFLSWAVDIETVQWALERGPAAMMFSFGDPDRFARRVRDAGVPLLMQVADLDEAKRALDLEADVIVAQGGEAGGHGGTKWATLPFVPAVVDLAGATPVLAAGGIADGRGVAAALVLGAAGALIGTRFQATVEALVPAEVTKALLDASGGDTERSRLTDIARGADWPHKYTARTVRNEYLERWIGREDEFGDDVAAQSAYREAIARGDAPALPLWAGQAVELITEVESAAELVARLVAEAERALARAGNG